MHINIQCLTNKLHALEILSEKENIDIVCISEHWLTEENKDIYKLNNFDCTSIYIRKNYIHGGVGVFVRKHILSSSISDIEAFSTDKHCELAAVNLVKQNIVIMSIYRSPEGDIRKFIDILNDALNWIQCNFNSEVKLVLTGDFNIDFNTNSPPKNEIIRLMINYGLLQTIYDYTRIMKNSKTCIDNIFTNTDKYLNAKVHDYTISDHLPQMISISSQEEDITKIRRIYSEENYNTFTHLISKENWDIVYKTNDPNIMCKTFINIISENLEVAFPKLPLKRRNQTMKVSKDLEEMKVNLKLMQRLQSDMGNEESGKDLERYKQKYLMKAEAERKLQNEERIKRSDNKTKTIWDIINKETRKSKKEFLQPSSEEFNLYFTTQAENLLNRRPHIDKREVDVTGFNIGGNKLEEFTQTTVKEIHEIIDNLKNKNSTDIYDVNARMLKSIKHVISPHLVNIFNMCMMKGTFPDCLKIAKVHPIHKKGSTLECTNYRPISVLPILSKILEYILFTRLNEFLNENDILIEQQFGFRKHKSTVDAMVSLITYVCSQLDQHNKCESIMCDLTKAFDLMSPELFLKKAEGYGITGLALMFLKSYLEYRLQIVTSKGKNSSIRSVRRGVPQGSILGPLLFILFINDLPEYIRKKIYQYLLEVLYADDGTFTVAHKDESQIAEIVETVLKLAEEWFINNELIMNTEKTKKIKYTMSKNEIASEPVNFLGITIDSRLTWKDQVDSVCRKLSTATYAIKRMVKTAGIEAALTTYYSIFQSRMTYGIEIWGHSPHLQSVLIEQKKAIRSLENASSKTSCRPLFVKYKIMTVTSIYVYKVLIEIFYKRLDKLKKIEDIHNHNTRSKNYLEPPSIRLCASEFLRRGINIYNKCPDSWKNDGRTFKRNLKEHLTRNAYYKIEEIEFEKK